MFLLRIPLSCPSDEALMKVLIDHPNPFLLAHGGFQVQIEQTRLALESAGVEVEWLRWWDAAQRGDIIHFFGRPYPAYITLARERGMKVVISELLTSMGSMPTLARMAQKNLIRLCRTLLPSDFTAKMSWDAYQKVDAATALTDWEKHLMITMFDAPPQKVHVIPNGVEEVFFSEPGSSSASRGDWLVCTAAITPRKRIVELAEAAVMARTPLWVIGSPYSQEDPYYRRFMEIVHSAGSLLRHEGAISDRALMSSVYRQARGFVLLSGMESQSLSALEASATGCPLLLTDLPWARSTFGAAAQYCPVSLSREDTAERIRNFHEEAYWTKQTFLPKRWTEVSTLLRSLYDQVVNTPDTNPRRA